MSTQEDPKTRLEYLRGEIRAERISYGEIAELQSLAKYIEPGDVELLEWAGVPEFPPTYSATFKPQAWVRDNAIDVDPEGETEWDCTSYVAELGKEWLARTMEHGDEPDEGRDYDDLLRSDPNAPEWVREWSGPFETYLRREEA